MKSRALSLVLTSAMFFAVGAITAVLGPTLPSLAAQTSSPNDAMSAVVPALFLGSTLAQLAAGQLNDRFGPRTMSLIGLTLFSSCMAAATLSPWLPLTLSLIAIAGLGHGMFVIAGNILSSVIYPERSIMALNLTNLFFGLGAVTSPALASLTLAAWDTAIPVIQGVTVLLLLLTSTGALLLITPQKVKTDGQPLPTAAQIYRTPLLWLLGVMNLMYVGLETGIGTWTSAYVQQSVGLSEENGALVASAFWLALTAGRAVMTLIGGRFKPEALLYATLTGSLIGAVLFVLGGGNSVFTTAALLIMGFCFGPVFPTMIALTSSLFPHAPGKAASIAVAMGNFGGMLLPGAFGLILTQSAPAMALTASVAALIMLSAFTVGQRTVAAR